MALQQTVGLGKPQVALRTTGCQDANGAGDRHTEACRSPPGVQIIACQHPFALRCDCQTGPFARTESCREAERQCALLGRQLDHGATGPSSFPESARLPRQPGTRRGLRRWLLRLRPTGRKGRSSRPVWAKLDSTVLSRRAGRLMTPRMRSSGRAISRSARASGRSYRGGRQRHVEPQAAGSQIQPRRAEQLGRAAQADAPRQVMRHHLVVPSLDILPLRCKSTSDKPVFASIFGRLA